MSKKYPSNNRSEKKRLIQPMSATKKSRSVSKRFIKQNIRTKISRSKRKITIKHKNDRKKSRAKKVVEERKQMGTCYLFLIREGGDEEALRQKIAIQHLIKNRYEEMVQNENNENEKLLPSLYL